MENPKVWGRQGTQGRGMKGKKGDPTSASAEWEDYDRENPGTNMSGLVMQKILEDKKITRIHKTNM
eukprot:12582108-Prorocentrum_lima.AAC.1